MSEKKVLLVMPTFWDVIAPPVGLVTLKSYLERLGGYRVQVVNLNLIPRLWSTQNAYLKELQAYLPHRAMLPRLGSELLGLHFNARVFREELPGRYRDFVLHLLDEYLQQFIRDAGKEEREALASRLELILESHLEALEQQLPALLAHEPDVVGCSVLGSTLGSALYLLRGVKRMAPGVRTVVGGPGPYNGVSLDSPNLARLAERCTFLDGIIFGEGEEVFRSFLEQGSLGRRILSNRDFGHPPLQLDQLPFLDYGDASFGRYLNLGIGSSRGCPYRCAFCGETKFWGTFRKMSLGRLMAELEHQVAQTGKNSFFFTDSLLNHSITPLARALSETGLKVEFDCYLRVDRDTQSPEMTALWAQAGLSRARMGMESASPGLLKLMEKEITPEEQSRSLSALSGAGVRTSTYWIVGHPNESEEDFQATLSFIERHREMIYETDLAVFFFFGDGESGAELFARDFGGLTERFPEEYGPLLLFKYYRLAHPDPDRVVALDRARRFAARMQELGIPCNRFSAGDYLVAEKRWQGLANSNGRNPAAFQGGITC